MALLEFQKLYTGLSNQKKNDEQFMKNPRGYKEIKITKKNCEITYVKWLDKNTVNIVSSFAKANPVQQVSRFDSKRKKAIDVLRQDIKKCNNTSKGGVDLAD